MGLDKSIQKLSKYHDRLSKGQAKKIKLEDLAKVERKLNAKKKMLMAELAECHKASKKERLEGKLSVVNEQIDKAHWLQSQLYEVSDLKSKR